MSLKHYGTVNNPQFRLYFLPGLKYLVIFLKWENRFWEWTKMDTLNKKLKSQLEKSEVKPQSIHFLNGKPYFF